MDNSEDLPVGYSTSTVSRRAAPNINDARKAAFLPYRVSIGAGIRERLNLSLPQRMGLAMALFVAYAAAAYMTWFLHDFSPPESLVVCFAIVGWLLCCIGTVTLLIDDALYLDRLFCIIPSVNPLQSSKILWTKLEEVSLIDLAKSGQPPDLALKMFETSGAEHFIRLALLTKEAVATLVTHIHEYASHARGLAQLKEIDRFHDYQKGKLENVSYTQLWESSCVAQFGLTSFTPLVPGAEVQGRFQVVKQIAAGGFSAIYLIHDERGESFVLKESVLPPDLDEKLKQQATVHFQREATLLSRLNHPHIAQVFDHFVENGRNYLRIQYIDGPNLRTYIKQNKVQTEDVTQRWMVQLAEILAYIHELTPAVVHRDLSPDNVVIRADGTLVVIDFGAANEFVGSATGTLIGKHAYMAPEQIRGRAEPVSDIYALGACGYYCLVGKDPEPLRTASPLKDGARVSVWFDGLVQQCMQLEREDRFGSARQCLDSLQSRSSVHASGDGGHGHGTGTGTAVSTN